MPTLMQIQGIEGESKVSETEGWLPVERIVWEARRHLATVGGGATSFGASYSAIQLSEVTVTRRLDGSTPLIWQALDTNKRIDIAFRWRRTGPGGVTATYFEVKLTSCRFVSVKDIADGGTQPSEVLKISFDEIEFTHTGLGDALHGGAQIVNYVIPSAQS